MKTRKPITAAERAWIKKVNKVLAECPSDRLGFYTIGDPDITVYDKTFDPEIDKHGGDVGVAVNELDCGLDTVLFPSNVHSTAG